MSPRINDDVFIRMNWSAFTTIGKTSPPRDPDEEDEDEDEEDEEEDSTDVPAVVREPDAD
jgi:hypothetical protein